MPTQVASLIVHGEGTDGPSVTTVLGALAKPALIGWAARQERKKVAALAGKLYERLFHLLDEPVTPEKFTEILTEEAGKGAHRELLEEASNVGTEVHNRIEWEFKGELGIEREEQAPALTTEQATRSFQRWTEWRASVNLKLLMTEHKLYSHLFGYGGTLDALVEMDDPLHTYAQDHQVPMRKIVVIDFKTGKSVYGEAFLQNIAYRMALAEEGIKTEGGVIVRLPKYDTDPEFDAVPVPVDSSLAPTFLALLVVYKWWAAEEEKSKAKSRKAKNAAEKSSPSPDSNRDSDGPTQQGGQ